MGGELIARAFADADDAGCVKTFVVTDRSNTAAVALHEAAGLRGSGADDVVLGIQHWSGQ
ncbi:MAG: hypothetical protein ACE5GC_08340 [Acidimicrobiia bacterium]